MAYTYVFFSLLSLTLLHLVASVPATVQLPQSMSLVNQTSTYLNYISRWASQPLGEDRYFPNENPIEGTDMILFWISPRPWIYKRELAALYASTNAGITAQVAAGHRDTPLVKDGQGKQKFFNKEPYSGMTIEISNILPEEITWSDLEDLMKGLEHGTELCDTFICDFEFALGHGARIGRGRTFVKR